MKLEGTLDTFPLRELIDMVVYSSVTGALNIYGPGLPGHLYFRDGTLYHVERGAARGVEALAELLEFSQASFAFVSDMICGDESLWGSLSHHLQTASRLAARWRQVRVYVPHLELVPLLVVAREVAMRRVGPAHHPVLDAITGHASLRQIAAALTWAEIDVAEAVVQMSVDGLVDLSNPQPGEPSQATDEPNQAPRPQGGIFDRLLLRASSAHRSEPEAANQPAPEPQRSTPEDMILQLLRS